MIEENREENFISMNLNQIYNMEQTKEKIILYLDNDTIIKIEEKL